jgi:thioredoxin reductase (NADPH)
MAQGTGQLAQQYVGCLLAHARESGTAVDMLEHLGVRGWPPGVRACPSWNMPEPSGPVLVAVDEDAGALSDVERELRDRYARHYRVICVRSPHEALACLEDLAAEGEQVALVLAGQRLPGITGSELLDQARHLHPHAKRGLLMEWDGLGDRATGEAIFDSIAHGWIDHYVVRPSEPPDEVFHQAISSLLLEWAEARRTSPHTIHVVGESWSGRAYELRHLLGRCAFPHSFSLADSSDGRALVAEVREGARLPIVVFPDGTLLSDPSNADLARAAGSPVHPERMHVDLVIVGAGPAGLSAAVYGASEGFSTLVVDEGGLGGQATSSPLIRNYLGFPRGVSGRRLALQAYEQAWVFGANFAFMQKVSDLRSERARLRFSCSITCSQPTACICAVVPGSPPS